MVVGSVWVVKERGLDDFISKEYLKAESKDRARDVSVVSLVSFSSLIQRGQIVIVKSILGLRIRIK